MIWDGHDDLGSELSRFVRRVGVGKCSGIRALDIRTWFCPYFGTITRINVLWGLNMMSELAVSRGRNEHLASRVSIRHMSIHHCDPSSSLSYLALRQAIGHTSHLKGHKFWPDAWMICRPCGGSEIVLQHNRTEKCSTTS